MPTGSAARGQKKERREKERKNPQRRSKKNNQTKTNEKDKKGATEARTEADAHGTSSETNTRAPTPQREETTHIQNRLKHARAQQRTTTEREERQEKEGYKLTPGCSTTRGLQRDRGRTFLTNLNTPTTQIQFNQQPVTT